MSDPERRRGTHTIREWLDQPEERRLELIGGEFVEKAPSDWAHSQAQTWLSTILGTSFARRGGRGAPGGWWMGLEIDIHLGENVFRPDLSGWRRDRVPAMPPGRPVAIRPDWIGEVLSEENASTDLVPKMRHYWRAGVAHYWIADPRTETLAVYRTTPDGFMQIVVAGRGETVRAEPFEAVELRVGVLFGDDPDDAPE